MPSKENRITARILCYISAAYVFGILLSALFSPNLLMIGAAVIAVIVTAILKKTPHLFIIILTCISLIGGTVHFYFAEKSNNSISERYTGRYVTITGQISGISATSSGKQCLTLYSDSVSALGKTEDKKLNFLIYTDFEKEFSVGDKVSFSSLFRAPKRTGAHGFDSKLYMHTKNITSSFFISSDKLSVAEGAPRLYDKMREFSNSISDKIRLRIGGEEGEVAAAILLGDKSGFSDQMTDVFMRSGISHIVAVSGMHLSILIGFFFLIAGKTRLYYKLRNVFGIILVVIYMTLTGFSPSVTRAGIMLICTLLASVFDRKEDMPTSFFLSAAIILMLNPYTVLSASFLLSYTSLAGILIFTKPLNEKLPRFIPGKIKITASATLSASILTLPVLAYMFNGISTLSVITNILVVPLVSIVFISSALTLLPGVGIVFAFIPRFLIKVILFCSRFISKIPFSYISVKSPTTVTILCFFVFVILLYMALTGRKWGKLGKISFYVSLCILTLSSVASHLTYSVTFFDIGQGDCALIKAAGGGRYLVDAGPDGFTTMSALRSEGINRFDVIFISHPDSDHCGALGDILKNFPTRKVVLPQYDMFGEKVAELCEIATLSGADVEFAGSYYSYDFGGISTSIISPLKSFPPSDENSGSLVLSMNIKNNKFLFTGDIDSTAESAIIKSRSSLDADVLKVSHHGSRDSTSDAFLKKVSADYCVISAGRDNFYGHPHDQTLQRLENSGTTILRTDKLGDIKFTIDLFGNMRAVYEAD